MNKTDITWADFTWNPFTGCTRGCGYCYARKVAARFCRGCADMFEDDTCGADMTCRDCFDMRGPEFVSRDYEDARPGAVFPAGFFPTIYPHRLDEPLRRKKPSVIFLGSMGDLFDPAFPDEFRDRVFATVAAAPQHTFMVLTKRVEEMRRYFTTCDMRGESIIRQMVVPRGHIKTLPEWPLPNLWLGVTVTNQADADERIPLLLYTPAVHRFVSVEPMLGPVDLTGGLGFSYSQTDTGETWVVPAVNLVIVGGKTPGKPLHEQHGLEWNTELGPIDYLRSLRDRCLAVGVPLHYKHGGTNPPLDGVVYDYKGGRS